MSENNIDNLIEAVLLILLVTIFTSCTVLTTAKADPNVDVSIYSASEKGKALIRVTYEGCVTDFLVKLASMSDPKAIDAVVEKAASRAERGCK